MHDQAVVRTGDACMGQTSTASVGGYIGEVIIWLVGCQDADPTLQVFGHTLKGWGQNVGVV